MSDDMASTSSELPELPELPDLPELEELPELPDLPVVPVASSPAPKPVVPIKPAPPKPAAAKKPAVPKPSPVQAKAGMAKPAPLAELKEEPVSTMDSSTEGSADSPKATAAAPLAPGERPPLRSIEGAPQHLKKAAMFVTAGAIVPFMNHGGSWPIWLGKVCVLLGAFMWFKQVEHNWGPKLTGFFGNLAEMRKKSKKEEDSDKPARRSIMNQDAVASLEHPFPTGLHIVSLVLIICGALVLPFIEPVPVQGGKAIAELGVLAWAAVTIVHIHAYERWGKFNPIFPLLFAGMAFAGVMSVIGGIGGAADGIMRIAMTLGGALVAIGGGLAAFTIVEAMMEAKKEGDVKKEAQLEERRKARATRRQSSK
ncbi:MAG: hypothetical protein ACI82F_001005 [Planctomycetota bacterium]|jgi:hypothetical protein